ncbi:MAG: hypothetical protein M0C28_26225 [Candidatus Moduliflexus flocculans]|nr:hypothetical protein [Candidatus Moduliflexus flocculans]
MTWCGRWSTSPARRSATSPTCASTTDVYRAVARGFLSTARGGDAGAKSDLMVDAAADHRPRAGPAVPHRLPARRQLLQARAGRSARPEPGDAAWPSSATLLSDSGSVRTRPAASSTALQAEFLAKERGVSMAVRELKIGASGVRGVVGRRAHAGADRELRLRLRHLVRRAAPSSSAATRGGRAPAFRSAVVSGLLATRLPRDRPRRRPRARSSRSRFASSARPGGSPSPAATTTPSWNALKFFGPDGALLNAAKNGELLDVYHGAAYDLGGLRPAPARRSRRPTSRTRYLDHLASALDVDPIRAAALPRRRRLQQRRVRPRRVALPRVGCAARCSR